MRHYYAPMRNNHLYSGTSRYFLILASAIILNACASLPDIPVTEESYQIWAKRQQQLSEIDAWEIRARTAIFEAKEVYQVGFSWVRERDQFILMIQAPLGQGVFRVESSIQNSESGTVKLTMPDGKVYYNYSAEAMLTQLFGWSIPVTGLRSWIKGMPQTVGTYSFELYGDGRLKSLQQQGWVINYLDYFSDSENDPGLPKKMYLKHPDLALKIVIDRWQPLEASEVRPVIFPDFD